MGIYEEIKECVLYFYSLNTLNNKKMTNRKGEKVEN